MTLITAPPLISWSWQIWFPRMFSTLKKIAAFASGANNVNRPLSIRLALLAPEQLKEVFLLAHIEGFTKGAVVNELRHNERLIKNPSNKDIDPTRSHLDYSVLEQRDISSYDYFLQRKSQLYCYNRPNVNVLAGWIVTAPVDLAPEQESLFFEKTSEFLQERYGPENAIQSIVHYDEKEIGRPHLHHLFIPVVPDLKHGGEKICYNDLITRQELRCFHPALQKYLDGAGIDCNVMNGITREIGGSISVEDLKKAEALIEIKRRERERTKGFTW